MDIFSLLTLIGGLAFFLYGMHVLSSGLEKMAGGKLEKTLHRLTDNPIKGLTLGLTITAAIQSSSALTAMLVGLVNSGIMELTETVGVIMGSNIGTTFTAWIFSLTGIESEDVFLRLLKPESFSPVLALIGVIMMMAAKTDRRKDVGAILIGFSVLMYGMSLMSSSVSPLAEIPTFHEILRLFANPLFGILTGAIFTAILQSSSASVGILQAISLTGSVTYNSAIPLIMGQNIGACVTSVIASIGANKNAKRVAAVHIYFNVIGTLICTAAYFAVNRIVGGLPFAEHAITPWAIALIHSIFNITTTLLLLPFHKLLEKLAILTVKDKGKAVSGIQEVFLDDRLLKAPAFALPECRNATVEMAKLAQETLLAAITLVETYDEKTAKIILEKEKYIDKYEDRLGTYLVKLASRQITNEDSREVSKLLLTIGDFERIGDHAVGILKVAQEMHDKGITFSPQCVEDLKVLTGAIQEIVGMTFRSFAANDTETAKQVEPLEQVIDILKDELKHRHIARLQKGDCTIELGFIFSDLLTNYQRISDHCSNIAVATIQIKDKDFDTHGSLNEIKNSGNKEFLESFEKYMGKYFLTH
ncbi:MAG: Na/Pi cotransporter family protein [Firmicutes bacterium]|nr:Na/Pi cotransporter family protein [Bacillota bacterium]